MLFRSKATIDGMAERGFGRIINITSGAVKAPIDVLGLSNGARSGLTGFVAGVARQSRLVSRNVTINNLSNTISGTLADGGKFTTTGATALSDADEQLLKEQGVDIARRTVAKYREAMNIPSSVQRRREKQALA